MNRMNFARFLICTALSASAAVSSAALTVPADKTDAVRILYTSGAKTDEMSGAMIFNESSGVKPSPYMPSGTVLHSGSALPSSYRTETTGIRNQGGSNSCWAFSGLGALEAYMSHNGRGDFDFSEQHLSWWATKTYNDDGIGWLTPNLDYGGYSMISGGYLASWQGPKAEEDLPYVLYGNNNLPDNMDDLETQFGVTGIMYVNNDIESVKTAVFNYGGVATSFNNGSGYNADKSNYYQSYTSSYFSGHAVTIIGWDDSYSRFNFDPSDQPEQDGAWLAKNSWGDQKGDEGYLWISYYDKYVLDSIWGSNLAITAVRTLNGYDRLYQNEIYGATYYTYLSGENGMIPKATFANVFNFDDVHKYLREVIFETQAQGAQYTVYYIPLKSGKPDTDRNNWTELANGTADSSGYIKADVSGAVEVSGKAAIGVEIDASKSGGWAQLGVDEWLVNSSGDYIFMPDARKNQSFIIDGSNVYDLLDVYLKNGDEIGGTLVIKAVAGSDVLGDPNDDACVTSEDALIALRETVGIFTGLTDLQLNNCDVNFDGVVTSEDALMILRRSLGLLAEF